MSLQKTRPRCLWLGFALAALAISAVVSPAAAQRRGEWQNEWLLQQEDPTGGWGPRVGLTAKPDQFHFGVHYDFTGPARRVMLMPSVELGLGDDATLVTINLDAAARLRDPRERLRPFVGAGVVLSFVSWDDDENVIADDSDTQAGLHIFGGAERRVSRSNTVFLELRLGIADAPDFKATVGMTFY
ncbi:MAG: hypothetical protein R6X25_14600 [Candidatus Krumholzibacteriia bacterium]